MQKRRAGFSITAAALLALGAANPKPAQAEAGLLCLVDAHATGTNTGESWGNAYTSLQTALTNAECIEIWVAEGSYKPTTSTTNRSASFNIAPGVEVYGGFAGNESERWERDPAANPTVLSGDISGNDSTDPNGVVLDHTGISMTGNLNSCHVLTMDGNGATHVLADTVLDGFTITAGQADYLDCAYMGGGGLYCDGSDEPPWDYSECSPTLSNLTFSGNWAYVGGGLYNNGYYYGRSSPILTNVTFRGNGAGMVGGAMYNMGQGYDGSNPGRSDPILANVAFYDNSATNLGGAIYNRGYDGHSNPSLTNVTFYGNSAGQGGAIYNNGDGLTGGESNPSLVNVIMWGDTAASGPEIYNDEASPTIDHSVVQGGNAGSNAGTAFSDGPGNTSGDPRLSALGDHGGFTQTMAVKWGSSAINAGRDSACAAAPVNGLDQRGIKRPQGTHCDIGAFEAQYKILKSQGAKDGWVLQLSEAIAEGGSTNAGALTLRVGDDALRRQYKSILSFKTGVLPDTAEILSATLRVKRSRITGQDPFMDHGNIVVDVEADSFGDKPALEKMDFQASASVTEALTFVNMSLNAWYWADMDTLAFPEVNTVGVTQFRLRFEEGADPDMVADYFRFYSGEAGSSRRPQLIITYAVP